MFILVSQPSPLSTHDGGRVAEPEWDSDSSWCHPKTGLDSISDIRKIYKVSSLRPLPFHILKSAGTIEAAKPKSIVFNTTFVFE